MFGQRERIVFLIFCSSETLSAGEGELAEYAEEGLKELIPCAGLAHIDSVIKPVLQLVALSHTHTHTAPFVTCHTQTDVTLTVGTSI